jgi:hypothetical protein
VHGICAGYLAAKVFGATEVYANFPQTAPENVVQTIQNLYAAAPTALRIVLVDIPIDLKNPSAFVRGLEDLALRHEVVLIDHHESSVQFFHLFQRVKAVFLGPSALTLNNYLLSRIPSATDLDRTMALVGAVGDRDPEVVRQNLYSAELQRLADGLDVMVRERDGALRALRALLQSPESVLSEARARADQIPAAQQGQRVGPAVVAEGQLPPTWTSARGRPSSERSSGGTCRRGCPTCRCRATWRGSCGPLGTSSATPPRPAWRRPQSRRRGRWPYSGLGRWRSKR